MNHTEEKSIADRIFAYVRENRLSAGDKLPTEKELAAMFGTSRVVVREGLQGLKFLGILESSTKGGTVIRELNFPLLSRGIQFQIAVNQVDWNQLTEARLAIELGVLESICGRLPEEQLKQLRRTADCTRTGNTPEELKHCIRQDCNFHHLLFEYSGNPILLAYSQLLECFFDGRRLPGKAAESVEVTNDHLQIISAIETGNLDLARGMMRKHLYKYRIDSEENKGAEHV